MTNVQLKCLTHQNRQQDMIMGPSEVRLSDLGEINNLSDICDEIRMDCWGLWNATCCLPSWDHGPEMCNFDCKSRRKGGDVQPAERGETSLRQGLPAESWPLHVFTLRQVYSRSDILRLLTSTSSPFSPFKWMMHQQWPPSPWSCTSPLTTSQFFRTTSFSLKAPPLPKLPPSVLYPNLVWWPPFKSHLVSQHLPQEPTQMASEVSPDPRDGSLIEVASQANNVQGTSHLEHIPCKSYMLIHL